MSHVPGYALIKNSKTGQILQVSIKAFEAVYSTKGFSLVDRDTVTTPAVKRDGGEGERKRQVTEITSAADIALRLGITDDPSKVLPPEPTGEPLPELITPETASAADNRLTTDPALPTAIIEPTGQNEHKINSDSEATEPRPSTRKSRERSKPVNP